MAGMSSGSGMVGNSTSVPSGPSKPPDSSSNPDHSASPDPAANSVDPMQSMQSTASDQQTRSTSVTELVDRSAGPADVQYTLTAERARIRTSSGRVIQAWTFNGITPGPQLTVRAGQLVQVTLHNRDISEGVTIHWHGVDVPNAMDGVAGVTQNAVRPGQSFVYRFRPMQAGTYWYHSHQDSATEVGLGLFGAFVVLPANGAVAERPDITVITHTWSAPGKPDETTIGINPSTVRRTVVPGSQVRLRLINTDNLVQHWTVVGADFRVAAIDGNTVSEPGILHRALLDLGAGGRYDVTVTMPAGPVLLAELDGNRPGILLLPPHATVVTPAVGPIGAPFDPLTYGRPVAAGITADSHFDASFEELLETHHATRNGLPVQWWTINGQLYPDVPMIVVSAGQLIRLHIVNSSDTIHPMHLHGHRVLVLSRNGKPATGSPWWADTVELNPGDDVVVALRADNPGIWMDHCHNLQHAAAGMMLHLVYRGVTTPFSTSPSSGNQPE